MGFEDADKQLKEEDKELEEADEQQARLNSTSYFSAILTGKENNHLWTEEAFPASS